MSLGEYAWSESEDTVYSHLYVGGSAELDKVKIDVESSFPWEGKVEYIIHPRQQDTIFTFAVRIPSYVKEKIIRLNGNDISNCIEKKVEEKDGYLYFSGEWRDGEHLRIVSR